MVRTNFYIKQFIINNESTQLYYITLPFQKIVLLNKSLLAVRKKSKNI